MISFKKRKENFFILNNDYADSEIWVSSGTVIFLLPSSIQKLSVYC